MRRFPDLYRLCAALAVLVALALPADLSAQRAGQPVLTIAGQMVGPDGGATVDFDLAALKRFGTEIVNTTTPWTDGQQRFEGIRLSKVLSALSADGETLTATALNDYVAHIPFDDVDRYQLLLAIRLNGRDMSVRDKGPIWLIYPDAVADHSNPEIRDRMIWQLRRIEVR